jgi:SprT-like family
LTVFTSGQIAFWRRYQIYVWSSLLLIFITLVDFPVTLAATGPIFVLMVIAFVYQVQWQRFEANWFNEKCARLGVQAKTWDELRFFEKAERRKDYWKLSRISIEEVDRIEAYLQKLADDYLPLFDGMPRITAELLDEKIDSRGQSALAYGGGGAIQIKKAFFDQASYAELSHTVKHEMTHCWVDWKGIQMSDPHGPEFQARLNAVR